MGHDPPHGAYPGGVPPPGGNMDHRKIPTVLDVRELVLTSIGGGHAGIGAQGYGGIHWEAIEHGGSVH